MINKINTTPLSAAMSMYEDRIRGRFKPDTRFYKNVGINRRRFGQLLRGEKSMLASEMAALAKFFDIPVTHFIPDEK